MFHIDVLSRLKDENAFIVKGWAFEDQLRGPYEEIEVEADQEVKEILYKTNYRQDVISEYTLDFNSEYGFIMKVVLDKLKGKVKLRFNTSVESDAEPEEVDLDFNRIMAHRSERGLMRGALTYTRDQVKSGLNFLKTSAGWRRLLTGAKAKLPVIDPVYKTWIDKNEIPYDRNFIREVIKNFNYAPLISILVPVYNVDQKWLEKMVSSVKSQYYTNWELCIADDCSTDEKLKDYLRELAKTDDRIKVVFREENGNISAATNSAYELATGDWIALLDDDDELSPDALFEVVSQLNQNPEARIFYSDEDKIDENGVRKKPYFKPDYSRDTLLSNNYICHFLVFDRSLLEEGEMPMRPGMDGAQDFDLILRLVERTEHIHHIPRILYHWRMLNTSTAKSGAAKDYIVEAGRKAISEALRRRDTLGVVIPLPYAGFYEVDYQVLSPEDSKVSVIIPTKNNASDIVNCIKSIVEKTFYNNYEIVVVDNGSDDEEAVQAIAEMAETYPDIVRVLPLPIPFNYSRINNKAAEFATGQYLLFLNDDTEVITEGWMSKMLGYAQQPWIGCVGAKLYYPDDTVQHAGVIMGIQGIAGHTFNRYPKEDGGYFGRLIMNSNYTAVTAACLMIEKKKFEEVGGFDEAIAVSFNDVDLCCKVAAAGYMNIYLASVELYHFESKSRGYETTPEKQLRFEKEKGRIVRKWREYIEADPMYNKNLSTMAGDFSIIQ